MKIETLTNAGTRPFMLSS